MIISAIILVFATFAQFLVNFLPVDTVGLPSAVITGIQQFALYLHTYDYYFPIGFALTCVLIIVAFEIAVLGVKVGIWIIGLAANIIP